MNNRIIITLLFLGCVFSGLKGYGQTSSISSMHENFDVSCVSTPYFAKGWFYYNPIASTDPPGAWHCSATDGNYATPGMECTGYYGLAFHLDTSYLITPKIDISSVSGSVFFRFDSRASVVAPESARLTVVQTRNDSPYTKGVVFDTTLVSDHVVPVISTPEEQDWVTHEINITPLKVSPPFHLVFMYTSTNTSARTWYLDNVNLSNVSVLNVGGVKKEFLSLNLIGNGRSDLIEFTCDVQTKGERRVMVYDMVGREVYNSNLYLNSGLNKYTLSGLSLGSGLYCLKIGNELSYGTAKVLIE